MIAPGAKKDFSSGVVSLVGFHSLSFIAAFEVADRGIERHGGKVSRILYYELFTDRTPRYILVYLTAEGLVTDEDVVDE